MKQELIPSIVSFLLQFSKEVEEKGKLKLYDINVFSEDVLVPILSIVFDTDLKNLNDEKSNFPGVDLATDEHITYGGSKKIAFQITSTGGIDKIKETLKKIVKYEFYKKFNEIYIYNLIEKQSSYQKKSIDEVAKIVDNKFDFDLNKNVIDRTDIEKKIKALTPVSKIEKIHKLLEDQFVYKKKSLLSLEIWESEGKIGYGFSNLLNGIDLTTYTTLLSEGLKTEAKDLIQMLLLKYNKAFAQNFENEKADKFKNLGFNTYLKAGFTQALNSFQVIKDKISSTFDIENFTEKLSDSIENLNTKIDESDYPLVNQPINHPAIKFIKTTIKNIFTSIDINEVLQDEFTRDFNQNVPNCIIETFGLEDYHKHKEQTLNKWIRENELEMLNDMKDLAKLGFEEGENLQYQETYGFWKDVRDFGSIDEDTKNKSYNEEESDLEEIEKQENKLQKVEELTEEYFKSYENGGEGYLRNILFLIADFGKGKTSFLHFLASKLAQNYLKTHEGLFPVYLNLNEYENFANSSTLGVISNYLAIKYKIEIKDEYFKKKNYFFLIDSLDECGELTESKIDSVIKDIFDIQYIDNINQRKNRIIIASRPIAKGLVEQIKKYKPFIIKHKSEDNKRTEETNNFISVYGFKKEQFDNYVEFALKKFLSENKIDINNFSGFSKKIISKIETEKPIGLYSDLYSKVLQQSELKRPIFAYMIYKLIISNSNFIDFGKVGVYISFLNQLSRDAKHKNEPNHKVSLKEEFEYRNILHASAILWQFKRQSGEQTSLTKADICRTIMEDEINKDDKKVLSEFEEIESIHFLSHSYLGEKENTLHFQHQSFAEILLAEYYLKVFINYAIDENAKTEDARIKLSLGIPTDQTIEFFKGLLVLLKECAENNPNDKTIFAKRELLIPLLASIATRKNNTKLYSTRLKATWFENYEEEIYSNNKLNDDIINNFPINKKIIGKIETLCQKIIESQKTYLIEEPKIDTILFKKELMSVNKLKGNFNEIDKWLALIAGNKLSTDIEKRQFFNSKLEAALLLNLIQNWNYNFNNIPSWGAAYFIGINLVNNQKIIKLSHLKMNGIDFSNSYFKNLIIENSSMHYCNFSNSVFDYFNIIDSNVSFSKFDNIKIKTTKDTKPKMKKDDFEGKFCLTFCHIAQGLIFPHKLNQVLKGTKYGLLNLGQEIAYISENEDIVLKYNLFAFKGLYKYIMSKGYNSEFIFSSFNFIESINNEINIEKTLKQEFEEFIYELEKEVKAEKEKIESEKKE